MGSCTTQDGSKKASKSKLGATSSLVSLPRRLLLRAAAKKASPEKRDNTPLEIPAGRAAPPSLRDEMRRFIREEISKKAEENGQPTFEEEDDFEIEESEIDLGISAYTLVEMAPEENVGPPESLDGDPNIAPDLEPSEVANHSPPPSVDDQDGRSPSDDTPA